MAGLGNRVKLAWLKGMEAVGKGASSMASTAHQKVAEINLETRRHEILSEFPLRAFELWQKGVELPEPLGGMMAELSGLDERLSVLRAQRYAKIEGAEPAGAAKPEDTAQPEPTDEAGAGEPEESGADTAQPTRAAQSSEQWYGSGDGGAARDAAGQAVADDAAQAQTETAPAQEGEEPSETGAEPATPDGEAAPANEPLWSASADAGANATVGAEGAEADATEGVEEPDAQDEGEGDNA